MDNPARPGRTPWVVLAVSLAFTAAVGLFVHSFAKQRDEARFRNAVEGAATNIIGRLAVYQTAIRSAAALFAANQDVSADQFHRYVNRLRLQDRYPGIQGLGWTARIAVLDTGAVDERHEIRYLEPLDVRNAAAIGFDMYSEPTRRAAMAEARDSGRQAISGKVVLVQEIVGPKQAGFQIYSPVYRGGGIPATVAERREKLIGFAYSPFRADDLFRGIFGFEAQPRVSFRVYDGLSTDSSNLLHASPQVAGREPAFRDTSVMHIASRPWTVVYSSEPIFERTSTRMLWFWVFTITGALASLWLFLFSRGQALARAQAETANAAKGNFLAVMSHELRTPLNAIRGYVDLMQLEIPGPTTPEQQKYLARIQHAQQHLLGLINSVLNYSKLESHNVDFHPERCALDELVGEVETLLMPQVANAHLDYANEGGPAVDIVVDPEKFRQILLNLFSNAIKFTPRGGMLRVSWTRRAGHARIAIVDSGVGIPPEKLATIFDPFVQVDGDLTRTNQGTGLGLAIARELARGMNGDIEVRSEVQQGSTFTVTVPLAGDA